MDLGARLDGRHVLVNGAMHELGAHFAEVAARCGAVVTVAGGPADEFQGLVARLQGNGAPRAQAIDLAPGDEQATDAAFARLRDTPVHVLVNVGRTASRATEGELAKRVLAPEIRALWLTCTAAARAWREAQRGGIILNVAPPFGPVVADAAVPGTVSRAGIVQMTAVLALEWARYGIRVNALAPGFIETGNNADGAFVKRIPLRRPGRPEDLDGAFLLLATDASAWMTGTTITVDGGHLVSSL